jgi:BirA family biotin operon repressor/biotin-[acetyl-CoA-carboxylase] ligase
LKIIKLDATDSTNSFLKELAQNSFLEDYTVITTNQQTSGRGQMNNSWESESFKNLTFSTFTRFKNLKIEDQSYLNFAISLAVYDVLFSMSVPDLFIKWPNDIMSGKNKICGILVETTFIHQRIKNTVIGIGLNVHQEKFSSNLKNVSSLKNILNKEFDLDELLKLIVLQIQKRVLEIESNQLQKIYEDYHNVLYKKGIPTAFVDTSDNIPFMGIIMNVSTSGNIQIQLEDDSIVEFGMKEIAFAKV